MAEIEDELSPNSAAEGRRESQKKRRSSVFDPVPFPHPVSDSGVVCHFSEPKPEKDIHKVPGQADGYNNTYRLEPPRVFSAAAAQRIVSQVFDKHLEANTQYHPILSARLSKQLAQEIMDRCKALDYDRYKIIALVNIGQKFFQGFRSGSRCLWDDKRDTWTSVAFENAQMFVTGEVYALCLE